MSGVQTFAIIYGPDQTLAVQCPTSDGNAPTLESFDPSNPLQQWQIVFQTNTDGFLGFAFVNPKTNLSVTFNGGLQPLVVQPFSYGSVDQDAWSILNLGGGQIRIAWPQDLNFSWNDLTAKGQPGDLVGLWNDQNPNSIFGVQPLAMAKPVAKAS